MTAKLVLYDFSLQYFKNHEHVSYFSKLNPVNKFLGVKQLFFFTSIIKKTVMYKVTGIKFSYKEHVIYKVTNRLIKN